MIDRLGRVVAAPARKIRKGRNFKPGQVGAMVHDFYQHDLFTAELKPKTQKEYRIYLDILIERFGDDYWQDITAGAAREWLMERGLAGGASGAHSLYRTARAFFSKARLLYKDKDHPGIVPEEKNPFLSLNLSLPTASLIVWPRAAVEAFVALADATGQPSIGDAMVVMSWLGTRRQDWLLWPATHFDRDLLAFRQDKTGKPLVLPWSIVPELQGRVTAARARRTADAVAAATFFHDRQGLPWRDGAAFRRAFNELREELVKRHPTFPTRYYVGLVDGDPLSLPTGELTMRAMRHTCITLNHDAGVPRELIASISGHELTTIDDVMRCYTAVTADQATAALQMRMEHEKKGAKA
jgi:integrase